MTIKPFYFSIIIIVVYKYFELAFILIVCTFYFKCCYLELIYF